MPPGPLMIIGGAEDKLRRRRILREFVAASGGPEARIAVIPTASSLGDEVVEVYDALFRTEGAAEITTVSAPCALAMSSTALVWALPDTASASATLQT